MEQTTTETKEKLSRKERKARWKAAKKARRGAEKDYYRYAPWGTRVWNLYLKKPIAVLLVLALLVGLALSNIQGIATAVFNHMSSNKDRPLSEEDVKKLYELAPLDEEGAARINALPALGEDETWTICAYFVGSNLEDCDENDLSELTQMLTEQARAEYEAKTKAKKIENVTRFSEELKANGLELPAFFFNPVKPVASSKNVTEEVIVAESVGSASEDIGEMTSEQWSDKIQIVIQTGGAKRWSNQLINPNRTQRFVYKDGVFSEVANLPLEPAAKPETLADFLRFCKEEYPADHTMLILWNHGGGPFGYGRDSITGEMLTLEDIRAALSSVYKPSRTKPAFDIIGFDACLMSCLEVTHALDGFADYYCLSEEVEPAGGWDYIPLLEAMSADPTMSPAKVAQKIADSYVDYYVREAINFPLFHFSVTFSVVEARKAAELYDAYSELCKAQLIDAVDDLSVLAEIGRCSRRATRYGSSSYNVFNIVDLGNYMDYLSDSYPEECARVRELLGETVLYHRESGSLSDSTGMAVYVPSEVNTNAGLNNYLKYVYEICEDDATAALYYYKQAGCLNEEFREVVSEYTEQEPQVLDISAFAQIQSMPETDEHGFRIPVSEQLQSLLVDYELNVYRYDEQQHTAVSYGRDNCLTLDGNGYLAGDFDGQWICLDGQPLPVEIVSSTPAAIEYRVHVLYNGDDAWLELSRNRDTDEITVTGVRKKPNNIMYDANYLNNTRSNEKVEYGAKIVPLYEQTNFLDNSTRSIKGKTATFQENTSLKLEMLPKGQYLSSIVITDPRGDSYYSNVLSSRVSGGRMQDWAVDLRFFDRDSQ